MSNGPGRVQRVILDLIADAVFGIVYETDYDRDERRA
jgi:hypothetical protein